MFNNMFLFTLDFLQKDKGPTRNHTIIKNMLNGKDEAKLEKNWEKFMMFAQEKNLKLKPNKFFKSNKVEFGRRIVTVGSVQN